jgi:hypothetical protein
MEIEREGGVDRKRESEGEKGLEKKSYGSLNMYDSRYSAPT